MKSIVVWEGAHDLPAETGVYSEGFTMLSTTSGVLGAPVAERYTDARHYRIAEPDGALTAYGVVLLSPPEQDHLLIGFLSCHKFVGSVHIWTDRLQLAFDADDRVVAPGERWVLDPILVHRDTDRNGALSTFAAAAARLNHARADAPLHTGWSSWNALEDDPHYDEVIANAHVARDCAPMLDYIQIDDGYQAAMGDWFDVRPDFGGSMADLFQSHSGWFIRDANEEPLRSDSVSFGGWRHGP